MWRPRSRILSNKSIEDNVLPSEVQERYEKTDEKIEYLNASEEVRRKDNLLTNYRNAMAFIDSVIAEQRELYRKLREGVVVESRETMVEESIQVRDVIEETKDVVKSKFVK